MPTYQYYTVDVKAGTMVNEIPLYGVTCDKVFSGVGNFQGTFRLGTKTHNDKLLIDSTIPGKHAMIVKRDGVAVWGGPIWSRSYNTDAYTIQLTAQTFESIFNHIHMRFNMQTTGYEETTEWSDLIFNMQFTPDSKYNFDIVVSNTTGATGLLRPLDYLAAEYPLMSEPINQLSSYDNAFGYVIDIGMVTNSESINKQMRLHKKTAGLIPESNIGLDYPGNVANYWYTENAANGTVLQVGRAGNLAPGSTIAAASTLGAGANGYPEWVNVAMFNDIANDADLTARTAAEHTLNRMPLVDCTIELDPIYTFTGWNDIGKRFYMRTQAPDPRWPDAALSGGSGIQQLSGTLNGWALTPQSDTTPEMVRLLSTKSEVL